MIPMERADLCSASCSAFYYIISNYKIFCVLFESAVTINCVQNEVKMFPALLISLKFRKVKQAKVNRKLTNNSETRVLQKFQFYKKLQQILIKINKKNRVREWREWSKKEGIFAGLRLDQSNGRDLTRDFKSWSHVI